MYKDTILPLSIVAACARLSPERALMTRPQREQQRESCERTLAAGEQLDIAALSVLVGVVFLVRQPKLTVLEVEGHLPMS